MTRRLSKLAGATLVAACFLGSALADPKAYVINNGSAFLTVIDLGKRSPAGQITAGPGGSELYVLPDNRTALLTESTGNTVRKIDLITGQTASVAVGTTPGSIIVGPKLDYAYVANQGSNDISVVGINLADPTTLTFVQNVPVGTTPVQVNQSLDGKFLYTANADSGDISVIDTSSLAVTTVPLPAGHPNQFAENINGKAFIPAPDANAVYVFDMATNAITGTLSVNKPSVIVFSPDYAKVFVLTQSNSIQIFDAATLRSLGTLTSSGSGTNAVDMAVTSDGKYAYVAFQGSNGAGSEIDVADLTLLSLDPINVIPPNGLAGSQPSSISFDADENYVFAVLGGANQVAVIDTNTDRIVNPRLTTGTAPVALVQLNQPYVNPGGVVNGASFVGGLPVAPGSVISIFGEGLVATPGSSSSQPLSTNINSTQVLFCPGPCTSANQIAAPLFYTSGLQINAAVPVALFGVQNVTLQIVGPNGMDIHPISLADVSPGLFISAVNADGSYVGVVQNWNQDNALVTANTPAHAGDTLIIWATGLGQTQAPMTDGQGSTGINWITGTATVSIGGQNLPPSYAGQAPYFAAVYQINVQLPSQLSPGTHPLTVTVNGAQSEPIMIPVQ